PLELMERTGIEPVTFGLQSRATRSRPESSGVASHRQPRMATGIARRYPTLGDSIRHVAETRLARRLRHCFGTTAARPDGDCRSSGSPTTADEPPMRVARRGEPGHRERAAHGVTADESAQ